MNTVTIIAQGGGMTSAYHAGVIRALKESVNVGDIGRIVTSSGSAPIYSYLISNQQELIEPIWHYLVSSGEFVNLKKHPTGRGLLNIDFLVDQAIRRIFPFDHSAFTASPVQFEVGATDVLTGVSTYFTKESNVDFFELIRATCAVPYFYGKTVNLNGTSYCDGTIGEVVGLSRVQSQEKTLVILTRPDTPIPKLLFIRHVLRKILLKNESPQLQQAIWDMPRKFNELPTVLAKLQQAGSLFILQPTQPLPMFRIDSRPNRLSQTIEQGYKETVNNPTLLRWWNL